MLKRGTAGREAFRKKLKKAHAIREKVVDEVKFMRSWAQNPLRTGAVSPSSPELAAKMASFLAPHPQANIVELGPGTGVVTQAIIDRGFEPKQLSLIEYSADFCKLLAERFSNVRVHQGDAYALKKTLSGARVGSNEALPQFDGIVSSLPLLTRPENDRKTLLLEALSLLKPGAPFIQFSYGPSAPVKPETKAISVHSSEWIWKNLPPARVWVYRKGH